MKRNIYTCKTLFPLRAIPPDEFSLPESHLTTRLKIIENTFRVRSDLKSFDFVSPLHKCYSCDAMEARKY
jgi:hypothetical protein